MAFHEHQPRPRIMMGWASRNTWCCNVVFQKPRYAIDLIGRYVQPNQMMVTLALPPCIIRVGQDRGCPCYCVNSHGALAVDGSSRCCLASGTVGISFEVSLSHYIFQTQNSVLLSMYTLGGDVRVQLLCCKYMHANELKMVVPNVFLPARGLLHSVSCFSCIYWPCRKTSEFADKPRPNNTRGKPKPVGLLSFLPPAATWHFLQLQFVITAHSVSFPLVVV